MLNMARRTVLFTLLIGLLLGAEAAPRQFLGRPQRYGQRFGYDRPRYSRGDARRRFRGDDDDREMPNRARALYFITNDRENAVVALRVERDGTLRDGTITPTGGAGANGIDGEKNEPAVPDALFSQGALTIAGNTIFAVNAGSNTLSMLSIDPEDPFKLTMIGEPVNTRGEFPLSVAASERRRIACVANSGVVAGVACARFGREGLSEMDDLRPFDINQSTPPVGPTNTVSHVFFSGDEEMLFTTVKGNPDEDNVGFLSAFSVEGNRVGRQETRSSPEGTAVLFGSAIIPGTGNILATDASFGAAILSVDEDGNAETVERLAIEGQKAICWAAISETTGTGFITDVDVNKLVEMDVRTGELVQEFTSENGNPGMIDLRAVGGRVYALSPGNAEVAAAVTVFDISGGRGTITEMQNFRPRGVSGNAMGMAFI